MKNQASFCISIDCELAWGVSDNISNKFIKKTLDLDEKICFDLLDIFNQFNISATWAIVAAMLDNNNSMINVIHSSAWYNPKIIEKISYSKNYQELASHSYGHPNFNIHDEDFINEDFEKAEYFFSKNKINVKSFVFPRNQIKYLNLLDKHGIKIYRGLDKSFYKKIYKYNKTLGRVANLIDKIIPFSTNTVLPTTSDFNLTELNSSLLFISRYGYKKIITEFSILHKARQGIDKAIKNKECFHMWFHPSNFYYNTERQFLLLKKILKYLNLKRNQGLIQVKTLDKYITR